MGEKKTKSRRQRGRPPLPPGKAKRSVLNTRITKELRQRLEKASKASERSLTQEIEFRLEQSFLKEDARYEEFGGKENFQTLRLIGNWIQQIEKAVGGSWKTSVDARTVIAGFAAEIFKLMGAEGTEGKLPKSLSLEVKRATPQGKDLDVRIIKLDTAMKRSKSKSES